MDSRILRDYLIKDISDILEKQPFQLYKRANLIPPTIIDFRNQQMLQMQLKEDSKKYYWLVN